MSCNTFMEKCNSCLNEQEIVYVNALDFFDSKKNPDPIGAIEQSAQQFNSNKVLISFNGHTILPMPNTIIQFASMMPDDFYIAVCYPHTDLANISLIDILKLSRTNPIRIFNTCASAVNWLREQENPEIKKYT